MKKVHSLKGKFLEEFSFNLRFVRIFKDHLDPELVKFWENELKMISQEVKSCNESFNKEDVKAA